MTPRSSWFKRGKATISGLLVLLLLAPLVGANFETAAAQEGLDANATLAFTSEWTMNFQGQLANSSGTLLNGNYNMRFAIYDAPSGGLKKWPSTAYEQHAAVPVTEGLFSIQLGSVGDPITFNAFTGGGDRYLQIWACTTAGAGCTTYENLGRLRISSNAYAQTLALPAYMEKDHPGALLSLYNPGGGGTIIGETNSGTAIYGLASGVFGINQGIHGRSASSDGRGVYGQSVATSGETSGVYGTSTSASGRGVNGLASSPTGITFGVLGVSESVSGFGVSGRAMSSTGNTYGVYGVSFSNTGTGVYGWTGSLSGATTGVYGQSISSSNGAIGVKGAATAGSGTTYGVYGSSESTQGIGVYGAGRTGVSAFSNATSGTTYGLFANNASSSGYAVYAQAAATSGTNYGIRASTNSSSGYAGFFIGRTHVAGDLSASGTKSFLIDHPLDPANQYLYHYNVESPEPYNLYRGTAKMDTDGSAWVELPEYFEAINTDFSYQLTAVGAAMPNLHISKTVSGNRFQISGGAPNMSVSWQVTAQRNDPWVRDNGFLTETLKPAEEQGTYLYPQGYGQPVEMGRDALTEEPLPAVGLKLQD